MKFVLPIRTVSEANVRSHWAVRSKRAKAQRQIAYLCANRALAQDHFADRDWKKLKITLTRIGPRKLDSDNLAGSCKAIRDGIADALSVDDGAAFLEWVYRQRKEKDYSVEVEIK